MIKRTASTLGLEHVRATVVRRRPAAPIGGAEDAPHSDGVSMNHDRKLETEPKAESETRVSVPPHPLVITAPIPLGELAKKLAVAPAELAGKLASAGWFDVARAPLGAEAVRAAATACERTVSVREEPEHAPSTRPVRPARSARRSALQEERVTRGTRVRARRGRVPA